MIKFRKIAVILLIFAVIACSCDLGNYTPPTEEEKASYAEEIKDKDYCEIPNGMTFEDIQNIIYIDGKQIKSPCTLKDFLKTTDGFILTDENGTEINPDDSVMLAYFRKGDSVIRAAHLKDGEIAYFVTSEGTALKINNAIGIGNHISDLFEMLDCGNKYEIKPFAQNYDFWFTNGTNAVRLSATADDNGIIRLISFDADETVEAIPEKKDYSIISENKETETEAAKPIEPSFEITEWSMEELVSDMSIDNVNFSLPCSAKIFTEKYETEEFDFQGVTGRIWGDDIYKDGKKIAGIYYDTKKEEKTVNILMLDSIINDEAIIPEFNIMGITDKSTPEDVVRILGEPNFDNGYDTDYTYYFSEDKELYICFDEETKTEIDFLRIRYIS